MRWHLLLIIALAFLTACAVEVEQPEPSFITVEVGAGDIEGTHAMQTFEISNEKEDLFDKWQRVNEQRILDEKWQELVEQEERELEIDADLSDDWVQCDRDIFIDVEVENVGEVDEDEIIVHVHNEALGIDEVKVTDIDAGFIDILRFTLKLDDAERGDYQINVEVFIDGEEDEFQTDKFSGELEGVDSEELFVADCSE